MEKEREGEEDGSFRLGRGPYSLRRTSTRATARAPTSATSSKPGVLPPLGAAVVVWPGFSVSLVGVGAIEELLELWELLCEVLLLLLLLLLFAPPVPLPPAPPAGTLAKSPQARTLYSGT